MPSKPIRIPAQSKSPTQIFDAIKALRPQHDPQKTLLSVGDSWFGMFVPLFQQNLNLLEALQTNQEAVVIDKSQIGLTARDVTSHQRWDDLQMLIADSKRGFRFDLIMVSAGGNDLIDRLTESLDAQLRTALLAGKTFTPEELVGMLRNRHLQVLDDIEADYRKLIRLRDSSSLNQGCPILAHNYDFITPRNAPAILGVGPWACTALARAGITDPEEQKAFTDECLLEFAQRLESIVGSEKNFRVARTQGTLEPAQLEDTGPAGDWHDEIHPSATGFAKLCNQVFNPMANDLLG
jgi:hypothetical protein